jgi:hypothetical protein
MEPFANHFFLASKISPPRNPPDPAPRVDRGKNMREAFTDTQPRRMDPNKFDTESHPVDFFEYSLISILSSHIPRSHKNDIKFHEVGNHGDFSCEIPTVEWILYDPNFFRKSPSKNYFMDFSPTRKFL